MNPAESARDDAHPSDDPYERLRRFERIAALNDEIDRRLERALRDREAVEHVMPELLAIYERHAGARASFVATFDESLAERVFVRGEIAASGELLDRTRSERRFSYGGLEVIAQVLDVAGEPFGSAAAAFDFDRAPCEVDRALLERFCELLDNHLAAIALARKRYEVVCSISLALKDPLLELGIRRAVEILAREVRLADLVLVFRHEDPLEDRVVRYQIFRGGKPYQDSAAPHDPELDAYLHQHAAAFLAGDDEDLRTRLGIRRYREEVLITGVRAALVVGRLLVTSELGEFNTHDRELIDRFADHLSQRIVDFNREWKLLAQFFAPTVCERLMCEEGYAERWLGPRERDVVVMFADIAGFTRLSEQVLRTPEAVGRFIGIWSEAAVEIVWRTGGVFDKMVGDCVIGHWGPPFFETDARDDCHRALEAARELLAYTRSLAVHPELPELRAEPPPELAIGINRCPVSVGLFGPGGSYTAFGSGMNNTARLQGVARGGQILCMDGFVAAHGDEAAFGQERHASVKNVRDALAYRQLLR